MTQSRSHIEAQITANEEDDVFFQMSRKMTHAALGNKLTSVELSLWLYLCSITPFADHTSDGERIYRNIPSPAELAILLGRSQRAIEQAAKKLEDLKLYTTDKPEDVVVSFSNCVEECADRNTKEPETLSVNPEVPVVQDPRCVSNSSNQTKVLSVSQFSSEKIPPVAHVKLTQHEVLIREFGEWLVNTRRNEYLGELGRLMTVMKEADEQVLQNALACVKEKIDTITNFGGYLRRAIDGQWKPQQANVAPVASAPSKTLPPLDKSGFPRVSRWELEKMLPAPRGYSAKFEASWQKTMVKFRQQEIRFTADELGIDAWGMLNQLSPIQEYFTSKDLDFETIRPHLAGEYLIYESDKLPVICFCEPTTGEYKLVVVTR